MPTLTLVPIYLSDRREMLTSLAGRLRAAFGLEVRERPPWFDAELPFDVSRGQYNSTLFLAQLLKEPQERAERVLAITSVDLYIPVLTYVFGEAQLLGRAAVVSIHRLRNEAYGLPADERALRERLDKEAIHELGHTYDLVHCQDPRCVMRSSTYVEEIDLKSSEFCPSCLDELRSRQR